MGQSSDLCGLRGALWWSFAFAVNLPMPVAAGLLVTGPDSRVGMFAAGLLLWLVGLVLCVRPTRLGPVLVEGSMWVAWSQLFPVLHVTAGVLVILPLEVMGVTQRTWGEMQGSFAWGFLVTFLTAQPLLLAAFLLGGGLHLVRQAPATEQTADYG